MKTLILDCNYIGHQARYSMGELSHGDIATGVIFGFLSRVLSLGQMFRTNDIVFMWDSRSSKRKKLFSGYKRNRHSKERTEEEQKELKTAMRQFVKLRKKILPAMGFANVYVQKGLEADDLICRFINDNPGDFIIVGSDEDLFQCLRNNVRMYSPARKKMMSSERFQEQYGIWPPSWPLVKMIAGCSTDEVPGVPGVGEKTAVKWIKNELKPKTKAYRRISKFLNKKKKKWKRNKKLIVLPFDGTQSMPHKRNSFKVSRFKRICMKYGLISFTQQRWSEWKRFFKGNFPSDEPEITVKRRRTR